MKQLLIILTLFIGIGAQAQVKDHYMYFLQFDKESTSTATISKVDTIAIQCYKLAPIVISYKQNVLNNDSTAIYMDGIRYNVFSKIELPVLNPYIMETFPTEPIQGISGRDSTNTYYPRKK